MLTARFHGPAGCDGIATGLKRRAAFPNSSMHKRLHEIADNVPP